MSVHRPSEVRTPKMTDATRLHLIPVARHVHRCAPHASLALVKRSGHSGHLLECMLSHQEAPTGL